MALTLSSLDEEDYYLQLYHQYLAQTTTHHVCDIHTILACVLNTLFSELRMLSPSDPLYDVCWQRIITTTQFLLALHHDPF